MTLKISFSEARNHLTDIGNNAAFKGERTIIMRKGRRLFAIVPVEDLEALEAIEDRIDLEDARKALADFKKNGGVSWEAVKKKLKL